VARKTSEADFRKLKFRISSTINQEKFIIPDLQLEDIRIQDVVKAAKRVTGSGVAAPVPGKFKVAIVGAGVASLFTAMLFEWLNYKLPELEIDYDIIEAPGENRLVGRLYTHDFSQQPDEDKLKDGSITTTTMSGPCVTRITMS
jgi:hypothetical protein